MAVPPLFAGAVKLTVADTTPGDAVTVVGAPGTVTLLPFPFPFPFPLSLPPPPHAATAILSSIAKIYLIGFIITPSLRSNLHSNSSDTK
jgi:hypothetical protein